MIIICSFDIILIVKILINIFISLRGGKLKK